MTSRVATCTQHVQPPASDNTVARQLDQPTHVLSATHMDLFSDATAMVEITREYRLGDLARSLPRHHRPGLRQGGSHAEFAWPRQPNLRRRAGAKAGSPPNCSAMHVRSPMRSARSSRH